ncbi:MAG: hypothetical protein AAB553_04610 [Patescibacteria group bacterium]
MPTPTIQPTQVPTVTIAPTTLPSPTVVLPTNQPTTTPIPTPKLSPTPYVIKEVHFSGYHIVFKKHYKKISFFGKHFFLPHISCSLIRR